MFNVSMKRVGGLRFVKVGRLTFSWSIAARHKPFNSPKQSRKSDRRKVVTVDAVQVGGVWVAA